MKQCRICSELKPSDSFHGRASYCKPCQNKWHKAWWAANRDELTKKKREHWITVPSRVKWDRHLKVRYGISADEHEAMQASQNYVCAICDQPETRRQGTRLSVDHCHATGMVRGLLCDRCNTVLGRVKDDVTILERAISYLRKGN